MDIDSLTQDLSNKLYFDGISWGMSSGEHFKHDHLHGELFKEITFSDSKFCS